MFMHLTKQHSNTVIETKLIELQGEIHESTIMGGEINTSLSEMDRPRGQKISKDIVEVKQTVKR